MPFGKHIDDELLSGYLDGQLSRDELLAVESALREDTSVAARLDSLRGLGERLRTLNSIRTPGLPADFASRVVAKSKARAGAVGESAEPMVAIRQNVAASGRSGLWKYAVALGALAGAVLLAFWLPTLSDKQPNSQHLAVDRPELPSDPIASNEVFPELDAELNLPSVPVERTSPVAISFLMVVDIDQSLQAVQTGALKLLLDKYGITLVKGVAANPNIEKEIDRLRFTVKEEEKPTEAKPAELYLVRASSTVLDAALEEMAADVSMFPNYRYDMAFQTPSVSLAQAIADAVGEQIADNNSVAVPVVVPSPDAVRPSPFDSIPYQGTLVSSSRRNNRFDSEIEATGTDMSYVLLLVRQP